MPCVSVWWSDCWCGQISECHVACVGPTCQVFHAHVGPTCADMDQWDCDTWQLSADLAHSGAATRHTLSPLLFCILYASYTQFAPKAAVIPKLYTKRPVIKSEPLICLFNLFYLLWIYFNSSTCPKILKFSPNIPKFIMITLVIFNSIFTSVSLC
jgi:hypothetical protein